MLLFWILLTVVVCFFLYLYMIMPNTSRRSKILPYLKRDYAHRGLHDSSRLIPENSMPAFREAVKQNLAIELDIHLTRAPRSRTGWRKARTVSGMNLGERGAM